MPLPIPHAPGHTPCPLPNTHTLPMPHAPVPPCAVPLSLHAALGLGDDGGDAAIEMGVDMSIDTYMGMLCWPVCQVAGLEDKLQVLDARLGHNYIGLCRP